MTETQIRNEILMEDYRKNKSKYKRLANKMYNNGKSVSDIADKIGWTKIGNSTKRKLKGASNLILYELLEIDNWDVYNKERRNMLNKIRYDSGFTPKLKKQIKLRDGNKCVICGTTSTLEIHHIDGKPTNNKNDNLITLCRYLHSSLSTHSSGACGKEEAKQYVNYVNSNKYFMKTLKWKYCNDCNQYYIKVNKIKNKRKLK